MPRQVNIAEAKAKLSELVDAARGGETIIIAERGKPVARLTALAAPARPARRVLGRYAHLAKDVDWDDWWRRWKAGDAEIERDFAESLARPFSTSAAAPDLPAPKRPKRPKPR